MKDVIRDWVMLVVGIIASTPLFLNARELGVEEARSAAAKPIGRAVFWYVLAALLIDSGRFVTGSDAAGPQWVFVCVPIALIAGQSTFLMVCRRVHPGILETASEEVVRGWRRRFFAGRSLWVFLMVMGAWAAVRFLVL